MLFSKSYFKIYILLFSKIFYNWASITFFLYSDTSFHIIEVFLKSLSIYFDILKQVSQSSSWFLEPIKCLELCWVEVRERDIRCP